MQGQLASHNPDTLVPGALNSLRVLDLTRVWAGPLGTRTLADFGADVIKISDPRTLLDSSARVNNKLNRNKRNIGIRLDKEEGREIFLRLVTISDIVVENYRPRVMRNLNLSYHDLRGANPTVIMCSMPGFGLDGPYSEYPAFGSTAEAISGVVSLIGYDPDRPLQTGLSYADPISGLNVVWTIMGYARRRAKAGMGCYLDLALSESPLGTLGEHFVSSSAGNQHVKIDGNRHPVYCPHGAFRALGDDIWVTIAVTSNEEWSALKTVLSDKNLENPCYEHAEGRKSSEDILNRTISQWAGEREADEIVALLQNARVPSGKVLNNLELLNNPHLRDRGYFVKLQEKKWGPQIYDGQAIPGSQKPKSTWHSMRNVGEDNRSILTKLLGYTQKEFKILEENGIVGSESFED